MLLTAEAALAAALAGDDGGHARCHGGVVGRYGERRGGFLSASPGGAPGSSWDLLLVATVGLMLVAVAIASAGVVREVRAWTRFRST